MKETIVGFVLQLIIVSTLFGQQPDSKNDIEIIEDWAQFQERIKDYPPEDRVALMEKWGTEQKEMRTEKAHQVTPIVSSKEDSPAGLSVGPISVNALLATEIAEISTEELSPEARIQRLEEAVSQISASAGKVDISRQLAEEGGTPVSQASLSADLDMNTPEGRLAAAKIAYVARLQTLRPEERGVAMEAAATEFKLLREAIKTARDVQK